MWLDVARKWKEAMEEARAGLGIWALPPWSRGSCGSSLSRGAIQSCLSVFIQYSHEPRVRSACAWGDPWSSGSFSLEQCLVYSRRVSNKCFLNELMNAHWTEMLSCEEERPKSVCLGKIEYQVWGEARGRSQIGTWGRHFPPRTPNPVACPQDLS